MDYGLVNGRPHWTGPAFRDDGQVQHVDLHVRCRQCAACKRAKAAHWRLRAIQECDRARRTWFGTLTLRPEVQFRTESLARSRLCKGGTDWDRLSEAERFSEHCREITKEFQNYMKRVRKGCPGLRHFMVFEPHKSGLPHCHVLIHESDAPVRHATLQQQWRLGFSKFNLVNLDEHAKAAHYVAKYLTKHLSYRVICSKRYGKEM